MIALFFDTETTGVKSWKNPGFKPALVQLGCILQDLETGRVLSELNLIANQYPGKPIPAEASNVHGITDDMAAKYGVDPNLIDITFSKLMEKTNILVAHNIDYDLDVIADNMPLTNNAKPLGERQFCTMDNNLYVVKAPLTQRQKDYFTSKGSKPDAPYKIPNLSETYRYYFDTDFIGAHDAMADIRACRDIFLEMIKRGNFEESDGLIRPTKQYNAELAKAKEALGYK